MRELVQAIDDEADRDQKRESAERAVFDKPQQLHDLKKQNREQRRIGKQYVESLQRDHEVSTLFHRYSCQKLIGEKKSRKRSYRLKIYMSTYLLFCCQTKTIRPTPVVFITHHASCFPIQSLISQSHDERAFSNSGLCLDYIFDQVPRSWILVVK